MSSGFQLARAQADAYERITSRFMDGSAALLAAAARLAPGDRVLDLACGTGLVARRALPFVGEAGRVVGADINEGMVAAAHELVGDGIEWVAAPCDALPFADGTFDRVVCQQGFQFFPDLAAAMAESARVLRPGGRLLATIWATPGGSPYIEQQLSLMAARDPSTLASVQRATPPHADELLARAAAGAGFREVSTSLLEHVAIIDDLGSFFLSQTGATPWAPVINALDDAGRRSLVDELLERMAPYCAADGTHHLPFASHLLHAVR
jgi:ubiquinone/menaquinone biosynthesis C-methylase UbiE